MKATTFIFLELFLNDAATGFLAPQQQQRVHPVRFIQSKRVDEIAHELEELGQEIHHQVVTGDALHGFDEIHETQVHALKKKVRDLKHQWQTDRKHLEEVEQRLYQLELNFQSKEMEWEAEENLLLSDIFEHEKEDSESMRKLLGKVVRLAGRRIKNGFKSIFRFGHRFP